MKIPLRVPVTLLFLGFCTAQSDMSAQAAKKVTCDNCPLSGIDPHASAPLSGAAKVANCHVQKGSAGQPIPDPECTPGAVNPTITLEVLQKGTFRTGCIRNCDTTESQKGATYARYGISKDRATCELDHLVPLEMGGADSLDNIWPQCGPLNAKGLKVYFREKDDVEDYLTALVKKGQMPLKDAQQKIATDWTKLKDEALKYCATASCGSGQ